MQKTIGANGKEEKTCEHVDQPLEDREPAVKCTHEKGKHELGSTRESFFSMR